MGYRFEVDDDDHILVVKTAGIWWWKRDVSVLELRWNGIPSWMGSTFELPDGGYLGDAGALFKGSLLRFTDEIFFSRRGDRLEQQFKPVVNLPTATLLKK